MAFGPTISLLTDFGLIDAFVGVMHGVIRTRCPAARIIDLTHGIPAQHVRHAGYVLADSWRYFPPGTIHVAVVDPGVGGDRRILAAHVDDQCFLAPDNGLLSAVFDQCAPTELRQVNNRDIFLKSVSATFHGRDIFAPTAGSLAAGMELTDVGPTLDDPLTLDLPRPETRPDGTVVGRIILVDRFGNLITNILGPMLPLFPRIEVGETEIDGLVRSYTDAPPDQPAALVASHGRLEIALNHGHAAQSLHLAPGAPVTIRPAGEDG